MWNFKKTVLKRWRDQRGQGLTEYLILMVLVCVVAIAGAKSFGSTVKSKFDQITTQVRNLKTTK